MDLTEIRTEVRDRIGETSADFFTDTRVDSAINEAVQRFSNEERWPWLFTELTDTMSAGSDELDLPVGIALNRTFALSISTTSITGDRMLERIQPMEGFRMRQQYQNVEAQPRWYYVTRSNLNDSSPSILRYTAKLIPTPDQDYDVEGIYMFAPLPLSGGSDEPQIPLEYQQAVPAYAAGILFLKELDISQKASEQFAIYNSILQNALRETKRFDEDEIVAWGRSKPSGRRYGTWGWPRSVLERVSPTGIGQ